MLRHRQRGGAINPTLPPVIYESLSSSSSSSSSSARLDVVPYDNHDDSHAGPGTRHIVRFMDGPIDAQYVVEISEHSSGSDAPVRFTSPPRGGGLDAMEGAVTAGSDGRSRRGMWW